MLVAIRHPTLQLCCWWLRTMLGFTRLCVAQRVARELGKMNDVGMAAPREPLGDAARRRRNKGMGGFSSQEQFTHPRGPQNYENPRPMRVPSTRPLQREADLGLIAHAPACAARQQQHSTTSTHHTYEYAYAYLSHSSTPKVETCRRRPHCGDNYMSSVCSF